MAKVEPIKVNLELTLPEATVLLYLLENVSGHGGTARDFCSEIMKALWAAKIKAPSDTDELRISTGEVEFLEGSSEAFINT